MIISVSHRPAQALRRSSVAPEDLRQLDGHKFSYCDYLQYLCYWLWGTAFDLATRTVKSVGRSI